MIRNLQALSMDTVYLFYPLFILSFNDKSGKTSGDVVRRSDECATLLENYAAASASFMFCALQNARPVRICCLCVKEYNRVSEEHENIIQPNNTKCNEKLINQDRLEVIENGFSYIKNLWTRGQCKNCLESSNKLSNTTKEFIKLYSDTNYCLENHYYPKNQSYNSNVCHICSEEYYKMSKFYTKLKETSGNGNVCMDIVDTVNVTQHLWSNVLHCGETLMTIEIPLIAISSIFLIIPVFFYLCAWRFTKDRSSAVLNQNRLSQRFRERWRSRANSGISSLIRHLA